MVFDAYILFYLVWLDVGFFFFPSSVQNLTEQALRLMVGGQPKGLPFFTTPAALVCSETGSHSSPGWPQTLLASASQVVGRKVCTTVPRKPALVRLVRTCSYKERARRPSRPFKFLSSAPSMKAAFQSNLRLFCNFFYVLGLWASHL